MISDQEWGRLKKYEGSFVEFRYTDDPFPTSPREARVVDNSGTLIGVTREWAYFLDGAMVAFGAEVGEARVPTKHVMVGIKNPEGEEIYRNRKFDYLLEAPGAAGKV